VGAGRVTVIANVPNFPRGKVFPGYRNRPWQRETMDGIQVVRVWTYIAANAGFALRTLDYLSFMVTGFIAGLWLPRPDVIVGTSPQFFTNCAAWMLSVFKWRPFVFELRDLWPESIKTVGAMKDSAGLRLLERLELFLYLRKADNFTQVIPSKLFECMGMGIPVLHGVAGESAGIVEREGVGLVFEPENAEALCDGLLRLAQDQALYQQLRSHCLAAAPRYDRTGLAAKMLGVLTTVAGRG